MSNEKELAPVYDDDDLRFGRDAIRLGYLQPDKMKVAISEQAQLAAKGEKKKLSEVLVNGAVIGSWKLEDEIGRGGMGIIFRARREDARGSAPHSPVN